MLKITFTVYLCYIYELGLARKLCVSWWHKDLLVYKSLFQHDASTFALAGKESMNICSPLGNASIQKKTKRHSLLLLTFNGPKQVTWAFLTLRGYIFFLSIQESSSYVCHNSSEYKRRVTIETGCCRVA